VAAIEAAFERPFAAKAIILQYNLEAVAQALRKVLIVYVKRHPFFVMQSILQARESFYGDRARWWSVKPREYPELQALEPFSQIAGQVWYTEKSLREQAELFSREQWIEFDYAEFCQNPRAALAQVADVYDKVGAPLSPLDAVPETLSSGDSVRIAKEDAERLCAAYAAFSGSPLPLPAS
jgi:hypothetical protein